MARYALVDLATDEVVNVAVFDDAPVADDGHAWIASETAGIGWRHDAGTLTAAIPPLADYIAQRVAEVEAHIVALQEADLPVDFAALFPGVEIVATDAFGNSEPAGVRSMQMKPANQKDWTGMQGVALGLILASLPNTVTIRCEDNCNVELTAQQYLTVYAYGTARYSWYRVDVGGPLKERIRACETHQAVDDEIAGVDWTWTPPGG